MDQQRSMAFDKAVAHTCPKILHFTFCNLSAFSTKGHFGLLSLISSVLLELRFKVSCINTCSWISEENRRTDFDLWEIPSCYTLPDYFSPGCCK
ncbi:hypothetical protein EXN66_Car022187 [Channa argus]|uniref:Uncharacterized protein n=1 Tax=Channa argus TaxID=215402 RepID=A0A6G1QVC7_CHAAH|nr:hypothetical protein EXN66_Car022187 [Channa argus]